jgi:putative membrane protein
MNAVMLLTAPRWGHMADNGLTNGMWIWGSIVMALWLGLAVVVTWLAIRSVNARGADAADGARTPRPTGTERAHDILAERYAKGEIGSDEYTERRAGLG